MTTSATVATTVSRFTHCYRTIFLVLLFAINGAGVVQGKGNGKGKPPKDPPPPPVLPDIRFGIEPMNIQESYTHVTEMENNGLVVGWISDTGSSSDLHAFLYDHDGFVSSQKLVYKLEDQLQDQLPAGWRLSSTQGVNRWGDLVGVAKDPSNVSRGFVVDTSATAFDDPGAPISADPNDWTLQLLPHLNSPSAQATGINDNGVVLVEYQASDDSRDVYLYDPFQPAIPPQTLDVDVRWDAQLNNHNQIAGAQSDSGNAFFYDPGDGVQIIDESGIFYSIDGLNDSGVFGGVVFTRLNGKGPNRGVPFRYADQLELVVTDDDVFFAYINEENDLLSTDSGGSERFQYITHAGFDPDFSEQTSSVYDLIDENDPLRDEWTDKSWVKGLTDRDPITGYPRLYGHFTSSDGRQRGAILTPFSIADAGATAVPEPATGWLLALAVGSLLTVGNRRRRY